MFLCAAGAGCAARHRSPHGRLSAVISQFRAEAGLL
jgi:hypothetical protein